MNVAGLNVGIGGDPAGLINALNASTRAVTQFGSDVTKMNSRINASALSIGRLVSAAAAGLGVREVLDYADAWKLVEARLAIVTTSTAQLRQAQRELFQIAQESRAEFQSVATLYTRLKHASDNLGLSHRQIVSITRTVTKALAIEGRSAEEVTSTIRQLSQAFASGRFQGDELRSVAENASLLFAEMAKNLGLTIGQLRELASANKITIQEIAQATLAAGAAIDAQAKRLPTTVGGAITQLQNSMLRFVGETDAALGATRRLVDVINALGRQFDDNRAAVETFAFVLGAGGLVAAAVAARRALIALAAVQTATAWLALLPAIRSVRDGLYLATIAARGFWTALTGPVGLAVIAVGIAGKLFFDWRKRIQDAREETDKLRESLAGLSPVQLQADVNKTLDTLFTLEDRAADLRATIRDLAGRRLPPTQGQLDLLQQYEQQIWRTTQTLGVMGEVLAQQRANRVAPPITPPDTDALKSFVSGAEQVIAVFKDMRDGGTFVAGAVERLREVFTRAQGELRSLKDPFSEAAVRLRKLLADLGDLPEIKLRLRVDTSTREIRQMTQTEVDRILGSQVPTVPIRPLMDARLTDPATIRRDIDRVMQNLAITLPVELQIQPPGAANFTALRSQVQHMLEAQQILDLAVITGDQAIFADAQRNVELLRGRLTASLANIVQGIKDSKLPLEEQKRLMLAIAKIVAGIGEGVKTTATGLQKFVVAGRGLTQIAAGFTNINKAALSAVGAILDAAEAMAAFKKAKTDKDVLGQISGAIGVAGAAVQFGAAVGELLFGEAKRAQEELRTVIRENNAELSRLTVELSGFVGSFDDMRKLLESLPAVGPAIQELRSAVLDAGVSVSRGELDRINRAMVNLGEALAATGFTMLELNEIAQRFGITLLDSEGRVIPQAFTQLIDAIEKTRAAALRFANTVDDTRLATRLRNAAFNIDETPQQILNDSLDQFRTLAPALWQQFFAGVNPGDSQAVRSASQRFVEAFLAGILNPDDFGAFTDKEQLSQFVLTWLDALNEMSNAADEVTKSLLNVPEGFKVERARFAATAAEAAANANIADFRDAMTGGKTKSPTTIVHTYQFGPGSIVVDDGDPDVFYEKVKATAQRKQRALGPTVRAADTFDQ